ncbi:MAG: hypothetical protein R3288_07635 [Woeseiaceae bacterium]|nr:hypothetical protein [Woeseiaceae bacterium]
MATGDWSAVERREARLQQRRGVCGAGRTEFCSGSRALADCRCVPTEDVYRVLREAGF